MPATRQLASRPAWPLAARHALAAWILLAVCLTPALTPAALAATSEACLRRCLANCSVKDKGGGESCLRPCLQECPVHCGTVDTECALAFLKREPALVETEAPGPIGDPWEATGRRSRVAVLVGRCAETCVVKPDCQPVSHEPAPPRPPVDLSPEPVAAPAAARPRQEWKRYEPKGRYFSLAAPQGLAPELEWKVQEEDRLAKGGDYEVTFLAKGAALLDYTQIRVRYVASPHRTAERFLHELERPAFAAANATVAPAVEINLSGHTFWRVETRGVRTLLGPADSVPVLRRTLVLPQPSGFFVLSLEAPEAAAEANCQIFERLAQSFRPQVRLRPRGPELSAKEREVYAAFFGHGGRQKKVAPQPDKPNLPTGDRPTGDQAAPGQSPAGAGSALEQLAALAQAGLATPPRPAPPDESVAYLSDTARARLVTGRTLAAPALEADALTDLARGCGASAQADALLQAWEKVRGQRVLVTDAIQVNSLEIEQEQSAAPPGVQGELMGRMSGAVSGGRLFFRGQASLSRVAFSADGEVALLYVSLGRTSPGTSHFVLLRRAEAPAEDAREKGPSWTVCAAAMRNMIIY